MFSKQTARAAIVATVLTMGLCGPAQAGNAGANNPTHDYWTAFVQDWRGPGLWDAWFAYLVTL